jgi:hypothetical protein
MQLSITERALLIPPLPSWINTIGYKEKAFQGGWEYPTIVAHGFPPETRPEMLSPTHSGNTHRV